jgi:DNA-binding GntR family transcriptional regulator
MPYNTGDARQVSAMSTTTKVDTIIDGLRNRIISGEFGEAGRLPSFRKLVQEYETSQETMNKAMQALQAEGLLLSSGARGVFVNNARIRIRMPGVVIDFSEHIKEQGLTPTSELIGKPEIIEPPKEVMKRLKLKKGQQVLCRQRKQGTQRSVLRVTIEYYPMHLITDSMLEQITKDPHYSIILAIRENVGKTIDISQEELVARLPNAFEQEQLQIVRTNPVIEIKSTNVTADEKTPILYYHKVLNANHFILSYNNVIHDWR